MRLYFHFAGRNNNDAKKSDDTYFYIAIGATIVFFFVGIAIGVLVFKKYHSRHCLSKGRVADENGKGCVVDENGKDLFYRLKVCYGRMFREV